MEETCGEEAKTANEEAAERLRPQRSNSYHGDIPDGPKTDSGSSEHPTTAVSTSASGNEDNATASSATLALTADDLGARMPQTLYELSQEKGFSSVVRVPRIEVEKLDEDMATWATPGTDCQGQKRG
ncbi:hypothetical protein LRP88_14909 [Fusarium phalaenopsidis]